MPLRKIGKVWYSDIRIAGKRVRKPLDTDERRAQKKLDFLRERAHDSKYGGIDPKWEVFKAKYLEWSKGSKALATWKRDQSSIIALESFHTPKRLSDITTQVLDRWKAARNADGMGAATINRELKAIKAMLRRAMLWGDIPNQQFHVSGLKEPKGKLIFFTPKECKEILARCSGQWRTMALLGLRAGLRRAEMHYLAWRDIGEGTLSVTSKPGWNPKNFEARHIPIPDDLRDHLARLKRINEWVLSERSTLGTMTTYFRRIVHECGLKGGLHTLRHTYASHLVQSGVDLYTISKLLGHSNIEVTQIYAHLAPKDLQNAVSRLPKLG